MAVIILAGGLSTRMGRDKACLKMGESSLLQSLVTRFNGQMGSVVVVVRSGQSLEVENAAIVQDIHREAGPLGGLHAGLHASPDDANFVLACDMPFASPELAQYLISLSDNYDVVVPRLQRGLEPLHAVYRKSCLQQVEIQLEAGIHKMRFLLDKVKTLQIPEDSIRQLDPDLRSFVNVNTPEDYDEFILQ